MRGLKRFRKHKNISPRYIGPYNIVDCFGNVAYPLDFLVDLEAVHQVFHVSLLKKCIGDVASFVFLESVGMQDSISYEEVPTETLDC